MAEKRLTEKKEVEMQAKEAKDTTMDNNTTQSSCTAKKRTRTLFTLEQRNGLEKRFKANSYPDMLCREEIAENLRLTPSNVHNWFQNKRSKQRRNSKPPSVMNYPQYSAVIQQAADLPPSALNYNFSIHTAPFYLTRSPLVYPQSLYNSQPSPFAMPSTVQLPPFCDLLPPGKLT